MKKNSPASPDEKNPANSTQWLAFLNLGWLIVGNMLVFTFGGLWLDKHYHKAPVFLLVGVVLSFLGSGYSVYAAVKKLESTEAKKPRK